MGLFGKLVAKLSRSSITPLDWDEARKELLASDLGPTLGGSSNYLGKEVTGRGCAIRA